MAGLGHHGQANELRIAKISGIVARHAARTPVDVAAAVAEIHEVTEDPHLIGHAWQWEPSYPVFADPWLDAKNALVAAAGGKPQRPGGVPDSGLLSPGLT